MTPSMLLGNSLCTTKKFFQKTVQRFKSFFSGDPYQKIPKPPARNNPRTSSFAAGIGMKAETNKDSASLYRDFTGRWDDTDKREIKEGQEEDSNSSVFFVGKTRKRSRPKFRKRSPLDDSSGSKNITEFIAPPANPRSVSSRPRLRTVR
ncbi:hypothetical protein OIU77_006032 [Salix suchowensis]|uniref:Uncharacterized protein n=1 Tax=Salix suchowensis TaxID=1278906 RepID=A0ABQ9ARI2_9ROSI|nr:hypothetical protein OIU77_006032 [Salix suchowensis]